MNVLINICSIGWHTITVTIVQRCIRHYCGILVFLSNCALDILRVLYGGCFSSEMSVKFVLVSEFAMLFCIFRLKSNYNHHVQLCDTPNVLFWPIFLVTESYFFMLLFGCLKLSNSTYYYDILIIQGGPQKSSPPSVCICIWLLY
jgi:hypothetical protein